MKGALAYILSAVGAALSYGKPVARAATPPRKLAAPRRRTGIYSLGNAKVTRETRRV